MNPSDPDRSELDAVADAALNEYLRRDSAVSHRYRELGGDHVPASLDHAVLAQAKAAVADKKPSRWRNVTRWSAPLALAASVVLVVSILLQPSMKTELSRMIVPAAAPPPAIVEEGSVSQLLEAKKQEAARADATVERANAPVMIMPPNPTSIEPLPAFVPAPEAMVAASPPPSAPAPAEKDKEADTSQLADIQQIRSTPATAIAPPPPRQEVKVTASRVAPKQAEQAAPAAIDDSVVASAKRREREQSDEARVEEAVVTGSLVQRPAAGAGSGPRGTVNTPSSSHEQVDRDDPAAWLNYIRGLRDGDDARRADAEWRSFRKRYPDFTVEPDDPARPKPRR